MRMLITGAASGIGRAVALGQTARASDKPVSLVLVDRDGDRLATVVNEVVALGGSAVPLVADLADPLVPAELVSVALKELGGLDSLVSNAGIVLKSPMESMSVEDFDLTMAVNARATWLLGVAAREALAQSRGTIVATASNSGTHPTPPLMAYCASKAALIMIIREMALEWGPLGIRCNSVSPGPTVTGLTTFQNDDPISRAHRAQRESLVPLRRVSEAEDVANAIIFLAGAESGTITGVDLRIDGGISLIPMLASRGEIPPGE